MCAETVCSCILSMCSQFFFIDLSIFYYHYSLLLCVYERKYLHVTFEPKCEVKYIPPQGCKYLKFESVSRCIG